MIPYGPEIYRTQLQTLLVPCLLVSNSQPDQTIC